MIKPNGYDETQISTGYIPPEVGGHHLIIKAVKEQESKTGKPMIVVAFDFAKNDVQPNYFSEMFEKDIRPEKKWPNAGTNYIMVMDYQDNEKTSRSFKSFITCVERSNNMICEWGDGFCSQFTGKKVGGVFGIVEEEYNGEVKKRTKLRWFCEDNNVATASIPDPKLLAKTTTYSNNDFVNVPDGIGEEIPF